MKRIKFILAVSVLVTVLAFEAQAQDPRAYVIGSFNGGSGTNAALAPDKSKTNVIATSEFNSAKLAFSVRGDGATSGNFQVRTWRTLGDGKYETTATTNLITMNGTTEVTALIDLSETYLANVASLRIAVDNTNAATRSITNILGTVRFNAPTVRIKSS